MSESESGSSSGYDDCTVSQRLAAASDGAASTARPDLECIVVRYRDRPDRCTFAPRECSETDRLTHWLSVDTRAVVDLEEVR